MLLSLQTSQLHNAWFLGTVKICFSSLESMWLLIVYACEQTFYDGLMKSGENMSDEWEEDEDAERASCIR